MVCDDVAFDKLASMWNIPVTLQSIKVNTNDLHFLGNGIHTEGRTSVFVYDYSIIHRLWQREGKLVKFS